MTIHEINMKHETWNMKIMTLKMFISFVSLSVKKRLIQVITRFFQMYNKGRCYYIISTIKFTYWANKSFDKNLKIANK